MASCLRAPAFSYFCPSAPSPCHVPTSKSTHRPLPLRAQVATIATTNEASLATRTGLPRRFSHLSSLACDLASASDISSALQPWLDKLTPDEWNALVLDSGSRDWNNAWQLFSAFEECTIASPKRTFGDASESNKEYLRICTSLLRVLCKFGRHEEIRLLQQHMERACIKSDDAFSNTLLEWYASKGLLANVSELLIEMEEAGIRLDPSVYEKIAFAYLRDESSGLSQPKEIMEELIKEGAPVSEGLFKNLIKGFWRLNDLDGAEEVFEAMKTAGHAPDLKVLLKLMELHSRRGNYKKVLELIKVRSKSGWRPTSMAYDYLLQAFCRAGLPKKAERVLLKYESVGGKPSIISYNMLIDSHVKLGQHEEALWTLTAIYKSGLKPSAVSYSSIIPALVKAGRYDKAEDLFMEMVEENIQPNLTTYQIMIQCFTKRKLTGDGHEMCISMRKSHDVMTNEAYGVALTLYLEGNWYKYAAITLMEIEKAGKSLTAASQNSLIRSFGTLGNIPNSLTKAVQESQFEVCKLLTSLFISNPKAPNLAPEHVDMVMVFLKSCIKLDDKKSMACVFNAFMDVFWKKNLKTVARQVLHLARKAYAGYTYPQFQDAEWILDVRGLSVGGAKIALVDWLVALREKIKTGLAQDLEVIIITGDDMVLDVVQDQRLVKTALMSMLDSLESPFVVAWQDPGKLEASGVDVVRWISQDSTKEALKLGNIH